MRHPFFTLKKRATRLPTATSKKMSGARKLTLRIQRRCEGKKNDRGFLIINIAFVCCDGRLWQRQSGIGSLREELIHTCI